MLHFGKIPATNGFAGRILPEVLDGGHLWRCEGCHLAFRWPTLSKARLDSLYAAGDEYAWNGSPAKRRDWRIAKQWLREIPPHASTVLDVGCFDGGFLDFLGDAYTRYGVEINPAARARAERKGITLIGDDLETFPTPPESLDYITAFDVIEHIQSPARFLKHCRDLIKPMGRIVVSTGNADSMSFRIMGAAYWYYTVAEHVSFISPRWCRDIADNLGLVIEKHKIFSHGRRDLWHYPPELLKNILYLAAPELFAWLRRRGFGKKKVTSQLELANHPPGWMTAKDHFIIVFQRR